MIELSGLKFEYPRSSFCLEFPDLKIEQGLSTAFVGPSGCGKTTLLQILSGTLVPQQGTVLVDGRNLVGLSDAERRRFRLSKIGMVFQEFELIEYLNVLDNVLLPCRIGHSLPLTDEIRRQALQLISSVGLTQHLHKSVTRLSQGERQRVAICRALLMKPALVLADEPTGNLDPVTSGHIMDLLFSSVARSNATLLVVTHDHSLLPRFGRIIDFEQYLKSGQKPKSDPAVSGRGVS
ncbi:MAG: ABC transporter ATP-binding protein [Planctomycetaceae bacterium]|nr:ABC transporter ATP-binding protein [Planctomycetaceae bacterium]